MEDHGGLPDLGPSDSKRAFKAAVQRLLDTEPPEPAAGLKRVETRLPEGKLRLGILPQRTSGVEGRVIMSEPAVATWNTSEEKIRKAIKKKKPQGRNVEIPSILAVYANGISTTYTWAAESTPCSTSIPASREICRRRSRVSSAGTSIPWPGA